MAHILVIDDDPGVRKVLHLMLESAGHKVHEAGSGDEAIRTVAAVPPELIFCDTFMPGRDGFETMKVLVRSAPGIPDVAMSGGGSCGILDVLPAASRLGAASTLSKPFAKNAVLQVVERALASRARPGAYLAHHRALTVAPNGQPHGDGFCGRQERMMRDCHASRVHEWRLGLQSIPAAPQETMSSASDSSNDRVGGRPSGWPCPRCRSPKTCPSRCHGLEILLLIFWHRPYRCRRCEHRFWRLLTCFRAHL
jgi:CheY-like chemotaxis protein